MNLFIDLQIEVMIEGCYFINIIINDYFSVTRVFDFIECFIVIGHFVIMSFILVYLWSVATRFTRSRFVVLAQDQLLLLIFVFLLALFII